MIVILYILGSEEAKVFSADAKDCASEYSLSRPSRSSPKPDEASDVRKKISETRESVEKETVWLLLSGETEDIGRGGEGKLSVR
jgi:hypothetical protein